MRSRMVIPWLFSIIFLFNACKQNEKPSEMNIIFLHHSTGLVIWNGQPTSKIGKFIRGKSQKAANMIGVKAQLPELFEVYNKLHNKNIQIEEMAFPFEPYKWANYPYDYYKIWVENAGEKPFMEQPTLEILTSKYQVIIFKHCFPVSYIQEDQDTAVINSDIQTLSNYKLQYNALRNKLHEFPENKFVLFTGAALVKGSVSEEEALRANMFFNWVKDEWDLPGDNIYLWDFYNLQTEGGLYFKDEYAVSASDSHPNENFAGKVVKLLFNRIIDVIENNGLNTTLTGEQKDDIAP